MAQQIASGLDNTRHGDLPRWEKALSQLPEIAVAEVDLNVAAITVKAGQQRDEKQQSE